MLTTAQTGHTVNPVYSSGGKVTATSTVTTAQIYDYTHVMGANVFTTFDGATYNSYLDLQIGDDVASGAIAEATTKTINLKRGYGWSAGGATGSTKNIDSDTWNFTWSGAADNTFSRKYTYDLTVTTAGARHTYATTTFSDFRRQPDFRQGTVAMVKGKIPQQTYTYAA